MKRYLFLITAVLAALFLLASCGCAEHLDKNGDARCDVCLQRLPEATAPAVTTAAPGTTLAPNASLPEDRELAERLSAALAEAYLGARLDIGLTAESAPYYRLEGEEGYVRLNADGTLEIIGVRARNTLLTLKTYDGRTVYQGFYCPGQRPLSVALRRALSSEGLIASEAADAPDTAIGALSALSLSGTPLTDVRELSAIRYMRSLSTLDLSGCPLGDLSYLAGLTALNTLDLSYAKGLSCEDGGIMAVSTLTSLQGLRHVSIVGAYAVLNRPIFDTLVTMTANGKITLSALEGCTLDAERVGAFARTVFFSVDELLVHMRQNGGRLLPGAGFSHAVLALSAQDAEESGALDVGTVSLIELYGREELAFHIPIVSAGDLTVNLYSYHLRATRENNRSGIHAGGALHVRAFGSSSVFGAGWDSPEVTYLYPGAALSGASVTVDTEVSASLTLFGGRGFIGRTGEDDGKSPSDITTSKNGGEGGLGAPGIRAVGLVSLNSKAIRVYGGQGGRGGDGSDGSDANIFFGGYDAGHGGRGGQGGPAVECGSLHFAAEDFSRYLFGGAGGLGGEGGSGFLGGKDGLPGDTGYTGEYVIYR